MLHLLLEELDEASGGGPVYWGKQWYWGGRKTWYHIGPMYLMSSDLTRHFGELASYGVRMGALSVR